MTFQRDLLPFRTEISQLSFLRGDGDNASSVSQKRRGRACRSDHVWLLDGLRSLNQLAGCDRECDRPTHGNQQIALRRLAQCYHAAGPRDLSLEPMRAYKQLLGTKVGYSDSGHSNTGDSSSYQRGAVKLPVRTTGGIDICSVLPRPWCDILRDGQSLLRPPAEAEEAIRMDGGTYAFDPVLRKCGYSYGNFLGDLWSAGLLDLGQTGDVVKGFFLS